ncbi:MAG: MerC domain-containing protein [Deltaproteobacteria bacterium]|nr:MerC domain-containing protein [Deltaproteobacteria bacterium]
MPIVDLIYDESCPNVSATRENLARALALARLPASWNEHRIGDPAAPVRTRGRGSPSVLVDGRDVAGERPSSAACCRLYGAGAGAPSVALLLRALTRSSTPFGRWRSAIPLLPGIVTAVLPHAACPACWPAYGGLLAALGLGFLMDVTWLLPLTAGALGVTLIALAFQARARRGIGPFALGLAAALVVMVGKFAWDSTTLTYAGVVALVGASVWNGWPVASCSIAGQRQPGV